MRRTDLRRALERVTFAFELIGAVIVGGFAGAVLLDLVARRLA